LSALEALLVGIVDYAGLFPPASQDMRPALENYATYLQSADRQALGRFIVPISRLNELEETGNDLLPRGPGSEPWKLSVLVSGDVQSGAEQILEFNGHHESGSARGHAAIDVVELKATNAQDIAEHRSRLPRFITAYFEIPTSQDVTHLTRTIAQVGARAKMRTGGVTENAFPAASEILDFMIACSSDAVAFKATAGLHHPVRGPFPLTYAPDSARGTMYGFLNLFLASVLLQRGGDPATARELIEERSPDAVRLYDDGVSWRQHRFTNAQLAEARQLAMVSFGSCSFREPLDDLAALGML
jgi:hypothetical protein